MSSEKQTVFLDATGRELKVGDKITYAMRRGSSLEVAVGVILNLDSFFAYNRWQPKITARFDDRHRDSVVEAPERATIVKRKGARRGKPATSVSS